MPSKRKVQLRGGRASAALWVLLLVNNKEEVLLQKNTSSKIF
jgi:hypothetical protein